MNDGMREQVVLHECRYYRMFLLIYQHWRLRKAGAHLPIVLQNYYILPGYVHRNTKYS
jgi:hypothetical protein